MGRRAGSAIVGLLSVVLVLVGVIVAAAPAGATVPGPYPDSVPFRPDGVLQSAPVTVYQPSFGHAAFVRGTDNGIWWSTPTMAWTPLGAPPGGFSGDPAVVSWGSQRVDLFVRGVDNKLWQRWTGCGGCSWSTWIKPVGDDGTLSSSPTATSEASGRIDVFAVGTDGSVYQRHWGTSAWDAGWVPRGAPASGVVDHPAAASWGPGRVDIFAEGTDKRLWQMFSINGSWSGWFQPAGTEQGTLASAPAASPWSGFDTRNRMSVFVAGTDNHLYQTTWDGGWTGWVFVGSTSDFVKGAPGVTTTLQTEPYILVRGTDDLCYALYPTDPLSQNVAQAAAYASSRSGVAGFTIIDNATGALYTGGAAFSAIRTASVIKVPIAMTLVARANAQHRGLTANESSLLHLMITQSDNNAATALWNEVGGSSAVIGLMRSFGATNTTPYAPSPGAWGFTSTTSRDLAVVLAKLAAGALGPLGNVILDQMHQVIPSQAWGIGAAIPGAAIKNGWYPDPGDWRVNCLGVAGGTRYAIAIMTQYPIGLGQGYGETTCQHIAARLLPGGSARAATLAPPAATPVPAITGIGMTADGG